MKTGKYTPEEMETLQEEFMNSRCTICGGSLPEGAGASCPKCDARWAYNINKKAGETEADRKATGAVRATDAKNRTNWGVIVIVVLAVGLLLSLLIPLSDSTTNSGSSTSGRYLSDQTKRKLYYDMIAVQEQYPGYSPEWSQGVKEAAAKSYNVPMSQIDDIVREGATKGWLQPSP
jgi:hypothetical protein